MAINVADNFSYKGSKPLDARIKYESVAAMAGAATADLYDGCLAYVTATKKYYSYDSSNTTDPTTGKWREYSSGGGGGADTEIIADDFDVAESYAVGAYVVYEGILYKCTTAHTGAWDASDFDATQVMEEMPTPMPAADMSEVVNPLPGVMSRRFKYSTTEQVVGEWIDGKPLYEISVPFTMVSVTDKTVGTKSIDMVDISADTVISIDGFIKGLSGSSQYDKPINHSWATDSGYTYFVKTDFQVNRYIKISSNSSIVSGKDGCITLRYTKTTD